MAGCTGLWVVVVAAGRGRRMGEGPAKQYRWVAQKPLLAHTLLAVAGAQPDGIVLVVPPGDEAWVAREIVTAFGCAGVEHIVPGGETRQASVLAGLGAVPETAEWAAVHDGARPLATPEVFGRVYAAARLHGAAIAASPVADTLRRGADDPPQAAGTVPRQGLWAAATPQIARRARLMEALRAAALAGVEVTDEAAALERLGDRVILQATDVINPKVTTAADLALVEALVAGRARSGGAAQQTVTPGVAVTSRSGFGFDVHRLVPGRPLILGGVSFAHPVGLLGHSDADVLTHAVMDALLGAAALGDIGRHFPDTDPAWAGADSIALLGRVREILAQAGFCPVQIDATLVAERPKIMPRADEMRARIATAAGLDIAAVGLKATTAEGLGFAGREEGIVAYAVATVAPIPAPAAAP